MKGRGNPNPDLRRGYKNYIKLYKNWVSQGKIRYLKSWEHGDAGGIIFINFGENYKNRFFIKTVFWI